MSEIWYPFYPPGHKPNFKIVRGNGIYVTDSTGREYVNGAGGLWNLTLGLGNDFIVERIQRQVFDMSYASLFDSTHSPAEQLAKKLISLTKNKMAKVYFSTTGTTSVEVAFRVAKLHYRSKKAYNKIGIVSFDESYHGCSIMNLSASGLEQFELDKWDRKLKDFYQVNSPRDEARSLQEIEALFKAKSNFIACFIVEPILASAGVIEPSEDYCKKLNALCTEYDVLLIADEVATGGGRCGDMFASYLIGLQPDIITLSKALNSGYYPLGATLFNDKVISPIDKVNAPILYGSTQDGNPVGCVAAMATLEYIEQENLIQHALEIGEYIYEKLSQFIGVSHLKAIRARGLMIALEFADPQTGELITMEQSSKIRESCKDEGLLTYHFENGISLFPPMTMTREESEDVIDILTTVLNRLN